MTTNRLPMRGTSLFLELDYALLIRADKIGSVVGAAVALVLSNLRIPAQRSSAVRLGSVRTRWEVSRDDAVRGFTLLDPLFEHRDAVEVKRTIAAATMVHSRDHQQTHGVLYVIRAAHRSNHTVVIVDCVLWGDSGVVPTVIQEELSSRREKCFQIWIGRSDHSVVQFVCERHVTIEVKSTVIPVRILEYQVFEVGRDNRRVRATREKV